MYWLLSSCVPDPERGVLRDWCEHVLILWIIESHMIYLICVSFKVALLFQLTIPNRMKPYSIISASCDEMSTTVVPANRVYCVWTTPTVGIWLKIVSIDTPLVCRTFNRGLRLGLEIDQAHGCKFVSVVRSFFHFKIVIRVIVPAYCRWKRRSAPAFHNLMC